MKLLKNMQRIALLAVLTLYLICLTSCQTANSSAKAKGKPHTSTENTNTKAVLYHTMAKTVTEQCPIEVDEVTTLTRLEYKEEQHALVYTYLLSGSVYEELSAQKWAVVQKAAAEMLKEKLKTNQLISQVRSDALTLIYVYKDKNDKELFTVTLLPDEY